MSQRAAERTERALLDFIVEELLEEPFDGGDPLATGALDSLGIEQLIGFAEDTFHIELEEEELVAENFESVPTFAALVDSKVQDT